MAKDRERSETMSLEQYIQFFESRKQLDLTMKLLNEIILIHGFKRIHKVPKKVLIDAIDAIELMDPSRSTLATHTSLPETMKLEEVIDDLNDLSWQECCVTSVQTLNSRRRPSPILSPSASAMAKPKKLTRPRKTLRSVYDTCASTSSSSSSGSAEKQLPRKLAAAKRKRGAFQRGGGGHAPPSR